MQVKAFYNVIINEAISYIDITIEEQQQFLIS